MAEEKEATFEGMFKDIVENHAKTKVDAAVVVVFVDGDAHTYWANIDDIKATELIKTITEVVSGRRPISKSTH